jgi:hypothetical protein
MQDLRARHRRASCTKMQYGSDSSSAAKARNLGVRVAEYFAAHPEHFDPDLVRLIDAKYLVRSAFKLSKATPVKMLVPPEKTSSLLKKAKPRHPQERFPDRS